MLRTARDKTMEHELKISTYEFYLLIRLINKKFEEDPDKIARTIGLTFPQLSTLNIIYHDDGLMISKIAKIGCWHISTVMSLLKPLAQKGYIKIKTVDKGKGSRVYITKSGKDAVTQTVEEPPRQVIKIVHSMGYENLLRNIQFYYEVISETLGEEHVNELKQHIAKLRKKEQEEAAPVSEFQPVKIKT